MKRSLNIAAFSRTTYWHGMRGGMDVHGKLLSRGLRDRGHRVIFIATRHPSRIPLDTVDGIEIHYLKDTKFGSRRNGWAKASAATFAAMHAQNPFDVVWSQSFDGFGLTQVNTNIRKVPMIATLHGCIQQEFTTFKANVRGNWYLPMPIIKNMAGLFYSYFITQRPVLHYATSIVTVSDRIKTDLGKWFGHNITKKCRTIHNGIDTNVFHPDKEARYLLRNRLAIHDEEAVLLSLGRITHEKGHHILIRAFGIIKQKMAATKLIIVGEGNNLVPLKELATALGLSREVIFTGPVDNLETCTHYNAADIFILPTLTVEGLPFVLLEAMACGKPVIASDIGGNCEVINHGKNGLLIRPGDITKLADEIISLIKNRNRADNLGIEAEATVKNQFSIDRMIRFTEQLMFEVSSADPVDR